MLIIIFVCVKRPAPGSLFCPSRNSLAGMCDLFKSQVKIGSVLFVEWTGATIIDIMVGALGNDEAAAYSIALGICAIYYSMPVALGDVAMATIGNAICENEIKKG